MNYAIGYLAGRCDRRGWLLARDVLYACIAEAQRGVVRVNDLAAYTAWRLESAEAALRGDYDRSLTFRQRATYIQTGDCPALLP